MTRISFTSLALGTLLLMTRGAAMPGTQDAARAPSKTVWDGVYTAEQAARGRAGFTTHCVRCHSAGVEGDGQRPLTGDAFWQSYRETTVDYLFDYIRESMPNGAGGTLSTNTYVDLVAFLLDRNGFPPGLAELTPESTAGVRIILKTGPGEIPNGSLTRVVGCLARGEGQGWIVTRATAPERVRRSGAHEHDARLPLGERTYRLMFVLTRLERYVGHRVSVSGLLMGDGGVDGINVTQIQSVAESCG